LILNVVLVGALMVSRESHKIEVPPNHAMEDANWVHEGSRWKCKINGCIDTYATKWLFCQHLDNKHYAMNVWILNNPHARQKHNKKKALD
jgi:hypothetical protein